MNELSAALHPLASWLGHQWWFIVAVLVIGYGLMEAGDRSDRH